MAELSGKKRKKNTNNTGQEGASAASKNTQKNIRKDKKAAAPAEQKKRDIKKEATPPSPREAVREAKASKSQKSRTPQRGRSGRGRVGSGRAGSSVRFIALGGLNEIGKNLYLFEYGDDMIIVDCGIAFPDEDMLGIDSVIPDFAYLEQNKDRIRGVCITHGHEDHIGGVPYLLKTLGSIPVYGSALTLGLIKGKLDEHGIRDRKNLHVVEPGDTVVLGSMSVEFIPVNHSIPDSLALAIFTPAGVLIHTGDFKVDFTPIQGPIIDLARFGELGRQGVLALFSDSTNSERPGSTVSESKVGDSFELLFKQAGKRRVIIATFSSNIHRVQQIIDLARSYGRKVALSGRSMLNVVSIARELGYLRVPDGILIDIEQIGRYNKEKLIIITTGSQGEPMSALTRMAMGTHRQVEVTQDDFIIVSASPIPGNEKMISRVINELMKQGANVIYESMYEVHVSGHACQEEQKLMLALTKPRYFIPVHGEQKHMRKHASTAMDMGLKPRNVMITDIGQVVELSESDMKVTGSVPAGRVFVDGLGVGDVGHSVLRDRKHLSEDGLIIVVAAIDPQTSELVSGPDIVSRGFVYVKEAEALLDKARDIARAVIEDSLPNKQQKDFPNIKARVREELSDYLFKKTKRKPMILPIILDI